MPSVSLITGHIDEPENGVYCIQCEHSNFDEGSFFGKCGLDRMCIITPSSYCTPGGERKRTDEVISSD